ncbi:hypothetical protein [Nitrosomonas sp.]|uniref:hypothetical protein n=1 Tax=Nitrosomonas sp. TaxID=42353 RepID=UPI0025F87F4A|nr:hypothetical protein [Nitrosomonas sp.]
MSDLTNEIKTTRKKIGISGSDERIADLSKLTPFQQSLRLATLREFQAKKIKKYVKKQVTQLNTKRKIAEEIKFLFDEHGQPSANMPIEDVVEERKQIENQIRWFEAITIELRNRLIKIKEIEDYALDLIGQERSDS